ncbi:MAG: phage terminase large subunit [Patescibacteria group bacterium]
MTNKNQNPNSDELFDAITKDPAVRRAVTRESHAMFFPIYLRHYIGYPMAEFQKGIIRTTEDQSNPLACIVAFRGSAKSTLITLSYSIWAVLGVQAKKFVLIVCQTQAQARQHMMNLRRELEQNALLKSDLGPFKEEFGSGEWAMSSLVFKNTGARIMVASIDQSIRGVRHYQYRPDLIILDDIEDLNSTRTMEGRNKTFEWFTREIVPLGDIGTRIVMVGNLLHEDSLMMRLRRKIEGKEIRGTFQWFPLMTEDGRCLWQEKFDTPEKVEDLRRRVANELAWQQEYLLNIVSDSTRVIWPEWIQYYDALPDKTIRIREMLVGIDLAISEREKADCTAVVTLKVYGCGKDLKVFVLPNPINKRMGFVETINTIKDIDAAQRANGNCPRIIIETNGFQEIYLEKLKCDGIRSIEGIKQTGDKRSRLALTSYYIQNGTILFPRVGAEELTSQLTGFGIENHDDLCDAFSTAVIKLIEMTKYDNSNHKVVWI